jgi:hypothetical protein
MSALIKANAGLPAHIQRLGALAVANAGVMNELSGGVTSGFPIISYKGKTWATREGGETTYMVDDNGNAVPSINVVIVRSNPLPSKIFYDKAYAEGTNEAPRCFSNDGTVPDKSVQNPISKTCAACPNNVWGSKITENQKKTKACADARRMAVVAADELAEKGADARLHLLRVPAASLNPVKDYAEKVLAVKGIPFFAVVTTIGFEVGVAHPQFTLKPARFLNEVEAGAVEKLRESEDARRILAEANEFPAGAAGGEVGDSPAPATAPGGTPAPAPAATTAPVANKPAKMRAATDEEAGLAAVLGQAPSPAPAAAAAPAPAPAAQKPKPAKAKPAPAAPAPAPAVVTEEGDDASAPASAGAPENFENLLDSILNS